MIIKEELGDAIFEILLEHFEGEYFKYDYIDGVVDRIVGMIVGRYELVANGEIVNITNLPINKEQVIDIKINIKDNANEK